MGIQLFMPKFDTEACLEQIRECLDKGWTGMGFKTVELEEKWKEYTGLPNAYYLNSSTAGLYMACDLFRMELGWDDNSEVITTALTFISTNHAIMQAGLKPVFADVDDTLCLDPESVREKITENTKAIMYVGMGGNAGHYYEIVKICKEHGLVLILDAAHMAGARVNGEIPGKEADVVVYSFQAVKNLPTADSGMICFKEKRFDDIARKFAWLGINKDTYARTSAGGNYKWKYDVEYVGHKYHGNSVIASIALVQLDHLDEDNAFRNRVAQMYTEGFAPYSDKIGLVTIPENCQTSRHLFQIIVENRDELLTYLNSKDIFPGVHYIDNTNYRMYDYAKGTCPKAEYYSEHILSLPLHLRLSDEDVQTVIDAVVEFVTR
ncbi:MAG: DegT/DnrJ/EryC1/StrS family aminotransferase [Clostridia bacterium]|nr:DegT/DnrJ/EryC1/StrS family aminotransferase [Clostridia bacterium]